MAHCLPRRLEVKLMRILSVWFNSSLREYHQQNKSSYGYTSTLNVVGDAGLEADKHGTASIHAIEFPNSHTKQPHTNYAGNSMWTTQNLGPVLRTVWQSGQNWMSNHWNCVTVETALGTTVSSNSKHSLLGFSQPWTRIRVLHVPGHYCWL